MWVGVAGGAAASIDVVTTWTVVGGVLSVLSGVLIAWLGARGTWRNTEAQREAAFEERLDKRYAFLEGRNEELLTELYQCRERHARLRRGVIAAGLDPDQLEVSGRL